MSTIFINLIKNSANGRYGSLCRLRPLHIQPYNTKPKEKFHHYLVQRYMDYLKKYEIALESNFPSAFKIYRIFVVGVQEFKKDLFFLFQTIKKVNLHGYKTLTRKEMEIYCTMPKDMIRVAPVLLITAIPMGGVIFPVAYMFPRKLLSYHFWSLQQRSEFAMSDHKIKLAHYRPVFRGLQSQLRSVKNSPVHKKWSNVLGSVGSGVQPTPQCLVECQELFLGEPYHLSCLQSHHISSLLKVHNLHRGWRRKSRLGDRGELLMDMDRAIINEGGVDCIPHEDLKWICLFRGLNPVNMRHEDIVEWLNNWLFVSQQISEKNVSLLLHCPILLGYNQPSNWILIYGPQK